MYKKLKNKKTIEIDRQNNKLDKWNRRISKQNHRIESVTEILCFTFDTLRVLTNMRLGELILLFHRSVCCHTLKTSEGTVEKKGKRRAEKRGEKRSEEMRSNERRGEE